MCASLCVRRFAVSCANALIQFVYLRFFFVCFVPCRVVQDIVLFCNFSIISYCLAIKYYTLLLSISL